VNIVSNVPLEKSGWNQVYHAPKIRYLIKNMLSTLRLIIFTHSLRMKKGLSDILVRELNHQIMKNCFSDPRVKSEGRGCVVTPKMSKSGLDLTDSVKSGKDFFLNSLILDFAP
jgi:hypothetical protein